MTYDLELNKAAAAIKKANAKLVCIQLPEGLKPKANFIQKSLEKQTKSKIVFWCGSCFGACDLPLELRDLGIDLLIQWGHAEWRE